MASVQNVAMRSFAIVEMIVSALILILAVAGLIKLSDYHPAKQLNPVLELVAEVFVYGVRMILASCLYFIGYDKKSIVFCWTRVSIISFSIILHLAILSVIKGLPTFATYVFGYSIFQLLVGIFIVGSFALWLKQTANYSEPGH